MSKKDKNKDTDKIKFFKIDAEGSIAEALPGDGSQQTGASTTQAKSPERQPEQEFEQAPSISVHLQEPIAMSDLEQPEEPLPEFGQFNYNRDLENRIEALKPQVEHISAQGRVDESEAAVLRKYISLKEAEVSDLKDQQKQYEAFVKKLSKEVQKYKAHSKDLLETLESTKRHEEALKREVHKLKHKFDDELQLLKNDYEEKLKQSGNYQTEYGDLLKKKEEWKDKIKEDLKKIKLKERELENKYELLKRDTQALLDSKDKHLLELKKKNDAFELEMETLEERLRDANHILSDLDGKKRRLIETLRLAISLIEGIDDRNPLEAEDNKRKAG